ncbi:MAG: DUF748 domain-containing protein [Odoribacter sp.]
MKLIKPFIITLSSIIAFFILIALILPPIAKNYINQHSKELIGRQINIKGLYLNIFTGHTRITDFQLLEPNDQDKFVTFDTLTVDIALFHLLYNELKINRIDLINPYINLLQNQSAFNFDDLLALGETDTLAASTPTDPSDNMSIALYDIGIHGGHILYKDLVRNSVWQMENLSLQIPGIYFSGKNTDVGINLNFNNGGNLQTAIQYNMEAGNYLLNIDLQNFSIAPIRPYLTDFLKLNAIDGILSAQLKIEGNVDHITELSLNGQLGLNAFSVTDHKNKLALSADTLFIDIENIQPEKQIFYFNTIAVSGINTGFELYHKGNSFTDLLQDQTTTTIDTTTQTTSTNNPKLDFKVKNFRINRSQFIFNDKTLHTPFTLNLENINISADNLTLNGKNKALIKSTLKNGGTITLNWQGEIDNLTNTDLLLKIQNLDLKTFTPYSLQYFGYPLTKGILSFNSVNNISNNLLDGRNNLNIAKCEVDKKHKEPKPEYNIPLKTALYLIKDVNDQIKIELPIKGNITSPEFSYKKIIFKTLTNLLVKVAVSPVNFLANSLGLSPDKLKNIPFEAIQNDFTPEQLTQINQLAEIIKAKPEMTLILEQFVNLSQSKTALALLYAKKQYYLSLHPEKIGQPLLPIDYSKIYEINAQNNSFTTYVASQVTEDLKTASFETQLLSLSDKQQISDLTYRLIEKRNSLLANYLQRQGVPEKCLKISTANQEKTLEYTGKNQYTIQMVFENDPLDIPLTTQENQE